DRAISVLLGNGDGTLRSARDAIAGFGIFSLAAGDFNGDGKTDVVTANEVDFKPEIAVLAGKGDGTFRTATTFSVPAGSISVAAADFNLDGNSDVVVGGASDLSMLLGNGNGKFQHPITTPDDIVNDYVLVGDFNGDGKPDVAVLSTSVDDLAFGVLLG